MLKVTNVHNGKTELLSKDVKQTAHLLGNLYCKKSVFGNVLGIFSATHWTLYQKH